MAKKEKLEKIKKILNGFEDKESKVLNYIISKKELVEAIRELKTELSDNQEITDSINKILSALEKNETKKITENIGIIINELWSINKKVKELDIEKVKNDLIRSGQNDREFITKELVNSSSRIIKQIDLIGFFEKIKAFFTKLAENIFKIDAEKHEKPDNALAVKIYDRNGKIVDNFTPRINMPLGVGGVSLHGLKNKAGDQINPATEDTLTGVNNAVNDQLKNYKITDKDDDASPNYFGYTDKDGHWFIMKETISAGADTYRYIKGDDDYTTNWTNRASLTFDYFYNIF